MRAVVGDPMRLSGRGSTARLICTRLAGAVARARPVRMPLDRLVPRGLSAPLDCGGSAPTPVDVWQLGEAIELSADRGAASPYLACSTHSLYY